MDKIKLQKIKNYVGIANKAGYVIWGSDNLKNYTHKIYLVLYREDAGNTIAKTLIQLKDICNNQIKLNTEDMSFITMAQNCKLCAIKNKGISDKILELLRSENIGK